VRWAAAALVLVAVAACRTSTEEAAVTTVSPARPAQPLALIRTPAWAERACRASRLLRPICPRRVPSARYRRRDLRLSPVGAPGRRFDVLVLAGRRARSPRVVRLVLLASRYGLGRSVGGVFSTRRGRGGLVLDRSDRSAASGRVVRRWQTRGVDYAIAIHAWEPVARATATLRAVVAATPAGPRRP
jgi:hypothetical protein